VVPYAGYRKGWILVVDDEGRPFCYLRRSAPRGPGPGAEKLRAWRRANGLTQKAAAKILTYSARCISRYELGRSSIPKPILAKLAKLAGAAG
jgi:DNA-binding XRE family transcriptional regulator